MSVLNGDAVMNMVFGISHEKLITAYLKHGGDFDNLDELLAGHNSPPADFNAVRLMLLNLRSTFEFSPDDFFTGLQRLEDFESLIELLTDLAVGHVRVIMGKTMDGFLGVARRVNVSTSTH